MCQFMRQQAPAFGTRRRELPSTEDDVTPDRVSTGIDVRCRSFGLHARVQPNLGKIVTETLLHIDPQRRFQRPTGTGKGAIYTRRNNIIAGA